MNINTIRARLAHMADTLKASETVNPLNTIEWVAMHGVILGAIGPYAEAHTAFRDTLDMMESLSTLTWAQLEYAIGQCLEPYLSARIDIAQALVDAGKG